MIISPACTYVALCSSILMTPSIQQRDVCLTCTMLPSSPGRALKVSSSYSSTRWGWLNHLAMGLMVSHLLPPAATCSAGAGAVWLRYSTRPRSKISSPAQQACTGSQLDVVITSVLCLLERDLVSTSFRHATHLLRSPASGRSCVLSSLLRSCRCPACMCHCQEGSQIPTHCLYLDACQAAWCVMY